MKPLEYALLASFLLVGCASQTPRVETVQIAEPLPSQWSLISAANRQGELEPCGCTMAPQGGLQREQNTLNKWGALPGKKKLLLNTGTTFVPVPHLFKVDQVENYKLKASYLVKALNLLGYSTISPTIDDLALGAEGLEALRAQSKFSWVSTNLYDRNSGKSIFPKYVEHRYSDGSLYILGLSPPVQEGYTVDSRYEARDPADALAETLKELPAGKKAVVILTSLNEKARRALMTKFPEVTVVLGGSYAESAWSAYTIDDHAVYTTPTALVRSLVRLDLELKQYPYEFFNAYAPPKKNGYSKDKKSQFKATIQVLGPELDEPKTEITKLVDEYKEKVRGLALSQD